MHPADPPASQARVRPKAIVFGTGLGLFPPLMQQFAKRFEVSAVIDPTMPRWIERLVIPFAYRPSRSRWYRRWRYMVEKTPLAFDILTRVVGVRTARSRAPHDALMVFGAMFAPPSTGRPIFMFVDSCRWLSSNNPYDEVSHFRDENDARRWFEREAAAYRSAARIFTSTRLVTDAIVEHYGIDPARVVTAGIGAGLGIGTDEPKTFDGRTILYIGKGDFEKKGGLVLLEAFRKVRASVPDAVLHVVGQDRIPETPGAICHGLIRDRGALQALIRSSHVLALPSLVDRFGTVLVEAMANGTPCVSSDWGQLPDVVGDAGLLVPREDPDRLAEALVRVLRDPELSRQLGQRGRERFLALYNWDTIWQRMDAEITAVMGPA